jgi:tight adherence protein C
MLQMILGQYGLAASSGLAALTVGTLAWTVLDVIFGARDPSQAWGTFERQRRDQLRDGSTLYRWLEPLIDELAEWVSCFGRGNRQRLAHDLRLAEEPLPWKPNEFVATKILEGVLAAVAIFAFVAVTGFVFLAATLALFVLLGYSTLARKSLAGKSNRRLKRIRLRLPFAVDQIALMMLAGAGFEDSLRSVVRQNAGHPLGTELDEVLRQVSLGRPRSQALNGLRDRLADNDVSEFVFAINKGEELGTPLSTILREQANQMRLKRAQWGEKAASEAEVQIVFPGMLVMIACLLVIIAPILLPALLTFLE